jgi:hypothetical protein
MKKEKREEAEKKEVPLLGCRLICRLDRQWQCLEAGAMNEIHIS